MILLPNSSQISTYSSNLPEEISDELAAKEEHDRIKSNCSKCEVSWSSVEPSFLRYKSCNSHMAGTEVSSIKKIVREKDDVWSYISNGAYNYVRRCRVPLIAVTVDDGYKISSIYYTLSYVRDLIELANGRTGLDGLHWPSVIQQCVKRSTLRTAIESLCILSLPEEDRFILVRDLLLGQNDPTLMVRTDVA